MTWDLAPIRESWIHPQIPGYGWCTWLFGERYVSLWVSPGKNVGVRWTVAEGNISMDPVDTQEERDALWTWLVGAGG